MNNKELYYFGGKCLTLSFSNTNFEYVKKSIAGDLMDWNRFAAMCSSHLVTPAIYLNFRDSGLIHDLPAELTEYLKEIFELNLKRNTHILSEMGFIISQLNHNGIEPVFIKGAGNLIDGLYSDPGERIMGDIDFLVKEEEYLQTARILESQGYKKPADFVFEVDDLKHYPRLSHDDKVASVEIHRLPVIEKQNSWFNQNLIRSELKKPEKYGGCSVLSDKHKFIINFIHSQYSDLGKKTGIISLRNVHDVLLISQRINPEECFSQISRNKDAKAYIKIIERLSGIELLSADTSFSDKLLLFRSNLSLRSRFFYRTAVNLPAVLARISGIFTTILKSVYSAKSRKYLRQRMASRNWRKSFLASWIDMLR